MARIRASSAGGGIGAEGLNKLNRDLRAIGKEAQGKLKEANVKVATTEGKRVQGAAFSLGGVAAHVAPGISGGGGNAWAGVKLGTDPAAQGAEFGGRGRPTTQQFQPWRGSGAGAGYFAYPTLRRDNESITEQWSGYIEDLMKEHGL